MRIVFGVLSLLLVLAIVGSLAKKQLQALNGSVTTRPHAAVIEATRDADARGEPDGATRELAGGGAGAAAADTSGLTVPQKAQNIQQQVRNDTVRALQQGVDLNARADP